VRHGDDGCVVGLWLRAGQQVQAVFALRLGRVNAGVVHVHVHVVAAQRAHDVQHLGVAQVGAVFFEGKAQHEHARTYGVHAALQHELDGLVSHIGAHGVVDAAPGEDDLRVIARFFGFVGEVVWIDSNTVPAHEAGSERQKVPLGACRFEHFLRVYAQAVEEQRELVDEGDVDVALGVFDDFGCLCHADAAGLVRAGGDDLRIQRIDGVGHFGGGATGDFLDAREAVLPVTGG